MIEVFREKRFNSESLKRIEQCNAIVERYVAEGLRLTLRQLYYQLVTVNAITNEEKSYKNLGSLVSDARLAGLIDWDAIEDRVRRPRRPSEFENLGELVDAAVSSYRLPRWANQPAYVELWVEKDALAGVLEPIAREHHVTLMVNRGYSSQSAMYEAANRFKAVDEWPSDFEEPREFHLFYLGDHDPSGEDMVRDVEDRLRMFGVGAGDAPFSVRKLALTMDQVRHYNPPPNPAKLTDSRAKAYIQKFGRHSWEVDALPPNVLRDIIVRAFRSVIDTDKMQAVKEQEAKDKAELSKAVEKLRKSGKVT